MRQMIRFLTSAAVATCCLAAMPARADGSGCIAHHPRYVEGSFEVKYLSGCSGHDEPELFPISGAPGSARDLTWTVILPSDGAFPVSATGPAFWFGGTVTDPSSLFGQAFVELQFYPDALVTNCTPQGGFVVSHSPNTYTVCSPVWKLTATGTPGVFHETAAFNAMLTDSATGGPLLMHAGDTITDHQYVTAAQDGMHITVTDVTTGHSGTIVLNSHVDGPLMPAFSQQKLGNSLGWGLVHDAPNSLVWEIGHTGNYTNPAGQFCIPGSTNKPPCYSFDIPSWLTFEPLQIKGVTFGNGIAAKSWAAVSDTGGEAEVLGNSFVGPTTCPGYGGPFCQYPWYAFNGTLNAFTFGGDYPGTTNDFGQGLEFQQEENCASPADGSPQYCATVLK